jgi:hypothetical protein
MIKTKQIAFGDFQTPFELSSQVVNLVQSVYPNPDIIIEPTCGLGSFIEASLSAWSGNNLRCYGFDINQTYINKCKQKFQDDIRTVFEVKDFFQVDWIDYFKKFKKLNILVVGNPPWVTNSTLGTINSKNLPKKSNFVGLSGFSAKTGKANFDIAEWMLIQLILGLQGLSSSCIAMLCKLATARKVLKYAWKNGLKLFNTSLHLIDAKKYFCASVDACLLLTHISNNKSSQEASVYRDLSFSEKIGHFALYKNELIADIDLYSKYSYIDGYSYYKWRSGIKHDASKVMELKFIDGHLVNGFGEVVDIEDSYVYPLLKSSDLGNNRLVPNRFVIITQRKITDDTSAIKYIAPKTWKYLLKYSDILDNRKSIIYRKRARFSIFGLGEYSFSLWKVAISGLYKNIHFSVLGQYKGKPIMVDDTCYFISVSSREEAYLIAELLNSEYCINFIKSLVFFDAKRPVNIDILSRVDLRKLAEIYGKEEEILKYLSYAQHFESPQQLLVFEKHFDYRTKRST